MMNRKIFIKQLVLGAAALVSPIFVFNLCRKGSSSFTALMASFLRVGKSYREATDQFDELLTSVTSIQRQTARGGAVIGDAFRMIQKN
jgi:hypothetical protein